MRNTLISAAVGAIAAALIAGGVAFATIPAPDGVIHACYRVSEDNEKGQMRVVSDPTACRNNEAPISWNQAGPEGETGPQGVDGRPGQDGVSVTSASEPAGANCTNGGSRFTAANGVTYACSGTSGGGSDVLTASVEAWHGGALLGSGGDAISSSRDHMVYTVTFPRSVRNCAAVASPTTRSGDFEGTWAEVLVSAGYPTDNQVWVSFEKHGEWGVFTSFHLIVVC